MLTNVSSQLQRRPRSSYPSTGWCISQVTDEVLYAGLVEMQELDEL